MDNVYWALMEKRWFAYDVVAIFGTEREALAARDHIFEQSGATKNKWSVQRCDLLTLEQFKEINYL